MRTRDWHAVPASLLRLAFLCCLSLTLFTAMLPGARAQGIESVIAPGKLIQGHAKYEDECKQCHVKFDRKAQDGLCMDCHKEIGADVRARTGFHGKSKPQACRTCHTDHKGRDARVVDLDKKKFDHAFTDFSLRGKHQEVECDKCHLSGKKYREAALECNACHKKDDVHKGSLGAKCADCHTENKWKEARFDHDKTRFSLTGKHVEVKCADCHKDNNYKETPRACVACHKKDDDQKGHKGQFGDKCESCHGAKSWKESSFNHDTDTKYALRGKHRSTPCATCHTGHLYKVKLSQECFACHKKDDKHKETLGKECGNCHTERNWKESPKFDHQTTSFPLLGKHLKTECKECHKSALFKEAPKDCFSCHKKDDKHTGNLGEKCADCHVERDWKTTTGRFNHDKTKFVLRNAHAATSVKCNACHKDLGSFRNTPLDCLSCHKKDDKHEGQEGKKCEQCHNDKTWKDTRFDHGLSRFPLTGKHIVTVCKKCHETPRYKDAPRDCYSCHKKEDKHKQKFGLQCETCHNARAWSIWHFEHDLKTSYKLDGGHRKVACESCHKEPAPKGKNAAVVGSSCFGCHRNEDVHDGQFGARCEQCHVTESWKKIKNRVGNLQLPTTEQLAMQTLLGTKKERWIQ
jgi:hypothetical protein